MTLKHCPSATTTRFGRTAVLPPDRRLSAVVALLITALLLLALPMSRYAEADTAPAPGVPATVSADPLPTWQVTGVVWSQVTVGNTVYATGNFTKARPPGMWSGGPTEINVGHLIAYDIRTGQRIASFDHILNAQGIAITASPDGSRVYVGGDFTTVNGQARQHVAAFDTATNQLVSNFQPVVNGQVKALAVSSNAVYVGGAFESAAGQTRRRLAKFSLSGVLDSAWAPTADDGYVWSLVVTPDGTKLVVGGQMSKINGAWVNGMGAVTVATGAVQPWPANQIIIDYGKGGINSLTSDGTYIYGTGFAFGPVGVFEGSFALNQNGTIRWLVDCLGDSYDVEPVDDVAYVVSHAHDCTSINSFPDTSPRVRWQFGNAYTTVPTGVNKGPNKYGWNYNGQPAPSMLHWYPELGIGQATGQYQAGWNVTSNGEYIALGGEFPTVNGSPQQGLTRYAKSANAPDQVGPQYDVKPPRPVPATTATQVASGGVRVSFGSAWDKDNESLTYQVYRDRGTAAEKLVTTITARSNFWTVPTLSVGDPAVPAGSHTYQVRITDPFGNALLSPVSPAISTTGAASAYGGRVATDGADHHWRLGETGTTTAFDAIGLADGTTQSGVTRGAAGAISGDPDRASTFNGTSNGYVAGGGSAVNGPSRFSVEAWFRTSSALGGKIVGFGSARTGLSGSYDRHLYLDNLGRVSFGVYNGSANILTSAAVLNNNQWHHVVGTLSSAGMRLYVDGQLAGSNAGVTTAQAYAGWWRIGGDQLGTWPNRGTNNFLVGQIDEVATYPQALSGTQVLAHRQQGTGTVPNEPPVANFTSTVDELDVSFNGGTSTDPDGSITAYAWNFGDGTSGTGATPQHTYNAPGTYPVTLTVTDNSGGTDSETKNVTVSSNQSPVAAFTSSSTDLTASFNASGSRDPDGSITAYEWDFGDGSSGSGATPQHSYPGPGTYQVELTVTDNAGASDSVTNGVVIQAPAGPLASDEFGRQVASGWGNADVPNAPWALTGSANSFAVTGGKGVITMASAGSGPGAALGFASTETDLRLRFSLDKPATGGGHFVRLTGRGSVANGYSAGVWTASTGAMRLYVKRVVNGTETDLASQPLTGLTFQAGQEYAVRLQVTGTGTTNLRAKLWPAGGTEPASWLVTGSDTTSALQSPGGVAVRGYVSGSATNAPVKLSIDGLGATTP